MLLPSFEMKTQAPHSHPFHRAVPEPGAMGMAFGISEDTGFVPFSLAFVSLSSRSAAEQLPPRLVLSTICITYAPQKSCLGGEVNSSKLAIWVFTPHSLFAYIFKKLSFLHLFVKHTMWVLIPQGVSQCLTFTHVLPL